MQSSIYKFFGNVTNTAHFRNVTREKLDFEERQEVAAAKIKSNGVIKFEAAKEKRNKRVRALRE